MPPMRCHSVHSNLAPMADSVACHELSTITITYAKRMLRLIEDKVRACALHGCKPCWLHTPVLSQIFSCDSLVVDLVGRHACAPAKRARLLFLSSYHAVALASCACSPGAPSPC